jgi:hypothetical protein
MSRAKGDFRVYRIGVALMDLVAIVAAVVTAHLVSPAGAQGELAIRGWTQPHAVDYRLVSAGLIMLWLLAQLVTSSYSARVLGSGADEYKGVVRGALGTAGAVAVASYLTRSDLSRTYFLLAFTTGPVLVVAGRYLSRKLLHRARRAGWFLHDVVVVGGYHQVADARVELDLAVQTREAADGGLGVQLGQGPVRDEWLVSHGQLLCGRAAT